MQNTLLVGLSRQMVLERQLDVITNNIANVNTNGFKADKSLFEEYLSSGAHEDNFKGADRRVSYVQDRGTFRDFSQGAVQQTGNPLDVAISGAGMFVVQAPGGERYTRDGNLQINSTGQLVTAGGN
ncbi:MAG: flagellar hook-basal body complex protein, partial [Sphingomonas sp.]|nr:flagellar hook-basal body complex protein [Sphingomonas sp.]